MSGAGGSPDHLFAAAARTASPSAAELRRQPPRRVGPCRVRRDGRLRQHPPALTESRFRAPRSTTAVRRGALRPATRKPYTSAVTIENNDISAVGRSNSLANDLTIYANHITVQGNDLTGTPNDAINMWGDRHTYSQNTIHDLSNPYGHHDDAFQTWTGLDDGAEGNPVTNLVIDRNVIHDVLGPTPSDQAQGPATTTGRFATTSCGASATRRHLRRGGNATEGLRNILAYNNTFVRAGANNTIELNLTSSGKLVNNVFSDCAGWGGACPTSGHPRHAHVRPQLAGGSTTRLSEPTPRTAIRGSSTPRRLRPRARAPRSTPATTDDHRCATSAGPRRQPQQRCG